jgi:phosphohistidine phosphatase
MRIYFFRHAHAEDAQGPEFDDFTRPLSTRGNERTQAAAGALERLGLKPVRVFSSPRLRARQTADILAKAFATPVIVREELNFGFNPAFISTLVEGLETEDEVLLIGHEPDFSTTIAAITGGSDVMMKKGSAARVDLIAQQPPRGTLVWLLTPRTLDLMTGEG